MKIMQKILYFVMILIFFEVQTSYTKSLNGFDLEGARIPQEEIIPGGPAKDGILSINQSL